MYSALLAEYVPRAAAVTSRSLSDTGATVGVTLVPKVTRAVADTGASVGDTLVPQTTRQLADTGSTVASTLPMLVARGLASTGSTVGATLKPTKTRALSSTAATVTDSLGPLAILRALADTGATITEGVDSGSGGATRTLADAGSTVASTLAPLVARGLSDYGVARAPLADTFTRTVANGWGTADSGDAWTRLTGVASEFSTDGSVAMIATTVTTSSRYITAAASLLPDVDITARIALAVLPVAQATTVSLLARFVDTSNHYRVWMNFTTSAQVQVRIEKNVGNVASTLSAQVNALTGYTAGAFVWVRFQVIGSTLRAKVWADGSAEPSSWTVTATDTNFRTGGATGVRLIHASGNSSTPTLSVDDFTAVTGLSDATAVVPRRALADASSSVVDVLPITVQRVVADSAAVMSDGLLPTSGRSLADTASAVVDAITMTHLNAWLFIDTGAAITELVVPTAWHGRSLSSVAVTVTDALITHGSRAVFIVDAAAVLSERLDGSVAPTTFRWPSKLELRRSTRRVRLTDPTRTLVVVRPTTELKKARPPAARVIRPLVYRP